MIEPLVLSAEDLELGVRIATTIAAEALWWNEACTFVGGVPPDRVGAPARQAVLGGDLYQGSAGIARFLGLAAKLSGEPELRRTALGAARHALMRAEGWSLYSGRLGAGLVALELATGLDEEALVGPAVEAIERAGEDALADAEHAPADLLSGLAGVIVGLVDASAYDLDGTWFARAFELGRALLGAARTVETGLCWPFGPGRNEFLCGMGHGASGPAMAFSLLGSLAPDEPGWTEAAAAARGFERGWFSPAHASWADLRGDAVAGGSLQYPHFWCHGSVGIASERLLAISANVADARCRADAAAALAGITAYGERLLSFPAGPGGGDHTNGSLCHGLAGVVDLLSEVWLVEQDSETLRQIRRLTAYIRNDAGPQLRWRSGIPGGGVATPGLMLGSAGIGWAHLRASDPRAVPAAWIPRLAPW